jgi:CheY-like chemotaxis protein
MEPPRILHVDDDEESLEQARDYLERDEIPDWGKPSVMGVADFAKAMTMLETQRFDVVILDVRLGGHEPEAVAAEAEAGVHVLEEIKARRFVPVVFWTGLPEHVRDLETPFVRVLEKTAGLGALASAVRETFESGLPSMNRALLQFVEEEQRRYMWGFVAPHWEDLRESADHVSLAYMLARRLGRSLSRPGIEQLAKELGEAAAEGVTAGKVHPAEIYILPPVESIGPGVGDIYLGADGSAHPGWWLLLTPTCDLHQNKAEYVVMAQCLPAAEHPDVRSWSERGNADDKAAMKGLLTQKTGGQDDRDLFLPGVLRLPDLVADLQRVTNVPRADLDALEQVASLDSPFAEAVVSRFIRYFGRVGTPDLDSDFLIARFPRGGA